MQITLRKAAKLQSEIQRYIGSNHLAVVAEFRLDKNSDPVKEMTNAQKALEDKVAMVFDLTAIMYRIRAAVGAANDATDIHSLLASDAEAKAAGQVIANLLEMGTTAPTPDEWSSIYWTQVDKFTEDKTNYHGRIHSSVLSAGLRENLEKKAVELRRQRNDISDKLLAINTSVKITVSDQDWATLEAVGLV